MTAAVIERFGDVTWEGQPQTAVGPVLQPGDRAPDAQLVDPDLQAFRLSDLARGPLLLSCVPSVDTPVCDLETRRWEQEVARLESKPVVVTVSMDLPFALYRWREANSIRQVLASCHMNRTFATDYGVLIKEKRLLSRAVFVIDENRTIRFVDYVREVDDHPDYEAALTALMSLESVRGGNVPRP